MPMRAECRRKRWFDVPCLALAVIAVRVRTFTAPPDDGNVGLYFYVAHNWLNGWLPYTRAWEYKPPGLFALFAAGLAIFRTPLLASAILSAIAVLLTALALRAIAHSVKTPHAPAIGTLAALFYIFLATEDSGLAGDAQLYAAAFSSWAIYFCAFSARLRERPLERALIVGLLAGLAAQMKLTALPLVALLALLAVVCSGNRALPAGATFVAAVCAPIIVEIGLYAHAAGLAQLYDANVGATLRRFLSIGAGDPRAGTIDSSYAQLHVLAPAAELAPFALLRSPARTFWVVWAWFACALFSIVLSREYYDRQFFDLIPPLAILGAFGAMRLGTLIAQPRATAVILVLLTFALHDYYTIRKTIQTAYARTFADEQSYNREHLEFLIAGLRAHMGTDRSLYAFQESPIVYLYLNTDPPTRYPFSADLIEPHLWPMLGFSGAIELQRILVAQPHYVLLGQPDGPRDDAHVLAGFLQAVRDRYRFVGSIDGDALYRLRAPQVYAYRSATEHFRRR